MADERKTSAQHESLGELGAQRRRSNDSMACDLAIKSIETMMGVDGILEVLENGQD